MILSDLLETLQNQRAYPYAEIRRDHVHETETSDDFEAMNVQLRREIEYRNGTMCSFYFFFLFISIHLFFLFRITNTYPGIHEDKVHLHKGEDHLQYGINAL